jgi:TonB family protein
MFYLNKLVRPASNVISGALLLGLLCSLYPASAQEVPQEAPAPNASQIKPPMIKPPMDRAQDAQGRVSPTARRRKPVRRKRRARRNSASTRPRPVTTTAREGVVYGVRESDGLSIKPPMANNGSNAPLNGSSAPRAPISAGVLNGRAVSLPRPAYPPIARAARATGAVVVQVIVDEAGHVITAHAISGHPLLRAAAVEAAWQARFAPTMLSGQPVKVAGTITYNFVQ